MVNSCVRAAPLLVLLLLPILLASSQEVVEGRVGEEIVFYMNALPPSDDLCRFEIEVNGTLVNTTTVRCLAEQWTVVELSWTPERPGTYEVVATAWLVSHESIANRREWIVRVLPVPTESEAGAGETAETETETTAFLPLNTSASPTTSEALTVTVNETVSGGITSIPTAIPLPTAAHNVTETQLTGSENTIISTGPLPSGAEVHPRTSPIEHSSAESAISEKEVVDTSALVGGLLVIGGLGGVYLLSRRRCGSLEECDERRREGLEEINAMRRRIEELKARLSTLRSELGRIRWETSSLREEIGREEERISGLERRCRKSIQSLEDMIEVNERKKEELLDELRGEIDEVLRQLREEGALTERGKGMVRNLLRDLPDMSRSEMRDALSAISDEGIDLNEKRVNEIREKTSIEREFVDELKSRSARYREALSRALNGEEVRLAGVDGKHFQELSATVRRIRDLRERVNELEERARRVEGEMDLIRRELSSLPEDLARKEYEIWERFVRCLEDLAARDCPMNCGRVRELISELEEFGRREERFRSEVRSLASRMHSVYERCLPVCDEGDSREARFHFTVPVGGPSVSFMGMSLPRVEESLRGKYGANLLEDGLSSLEAMKKVIDVKSSVDDILGFSKALLSGGKELAKYGVSKGLSEMGVPVITSRGGLVLSYLSFTISAGEEILRTLGNMLMEAEAKVELVDALLEADERNIGLLKGGGSRAVTVRIPVLRIDAKARCECLRGRWYLTTIDFERREDEIVYYLTASILGLDLSELNSLSIRQIILEIMKGVSRFMDEEREEFEKQVSELERLMEYKRALDRDGLMKGCELVLRD